MDLGYYVQTARHIAMLGLKDGKVARFDAEQERIILLWMIEGVIGASRRLVLLVRVSLRGCPGQVWAPMFFVVSVLVSAFGSGS